MRLKKPEVFTINRSKWVQGGQKTEHILGDTYLLNDMGNMCCLGFYSKKCGVPIENLREVGTPECIEGVRVPYLTSKDVGYDGEPTFTDSNLARELMSINDNEECSANEDLALKEKESLIREKFKGIGVKVRFTGEYPEGVV